MKQIVISFLAVLLTANTFFAQDTSKEKDLKSKSSLEEDGWSKGGVFNLNFSQVSLTNWAGGGVNSISLNTLFNIFANYKKGTSTWENSFTLGYGVTKQDKADFFKSDDRLDFTSKYGQEAFGNWYYAGLLNFRTQMFDGFETPGDSAIISTLLSPGYLIGAVGMDYKPNKTFTAFIAPATGKITFVTNQTLADAGAFGVDPGENIRTEFGGYVRVAYNKEEIIKNVNLTTKLDLFSNYLENPQNIDVNWETIIAMKVNKYLTASLSTLLIYDDDIDITVRDASDNIVAVGPRTQFKQVFGAGLSVKF